jgi:hypothetical protein
MCSYYAEMAGLSATLTAVVVGSGAAVVGLAASALTTRATLRVNRQIARDERLWKAKTELYEELASSIDRINSLDWDRWTEVADSAKVAEAAKLGGALLTKTAMYASTAVDDAAFRFFSSAGILRDLADEKGRDASEIQLPMDMKLLASDLRRAIRKDLQGEPQRLLSIRIRIRVRMWRGSFRFWYLDLQRGRAEAEDRLRQAKIPAETGDANYEPPQTYMWSVSIGTLVTLLVLLTALLTTLRLANVAAVAWWVVLAPIWALLAIGGLALFATLWADDARGKRS